ncbi:MAG TPA: LuxR C-terminal-related transcriptional regulator [Lacipirellula sp.]
MNRPIAERKRSLFAGISSLISGDAWIWAAGQIQNNGFEQATVVLMDGGWSDERQRAQVLGALVHPSYQPTCIATLQEAIRNQNCATCRRPELLDDAAWHLSPTGKAWRAAGFDEFLVSVIPTEANKFNWVGFHRKFARPPFNEQDRLIVHAVFSQAKWVGTDHSVAVGCENVVKLSPRERQVLLLLLGGDSRKQVASKLKLSPHTVSDHLKEIYRKLGVVTRAELLSKFIPGGVHAGSTDLNGEF